MLLQSMQKIQSYVQETESENQIISELKTQSIKFLFMTFINSGQGSRCINFMANVWATDDLDTMGPCFSTHGLNMDSFCSEVPEVHYFNRLLLQCCNVFFSLSISPGFFFSISFQVVAYCP